MNCTIKRENLLKGLLIVNKLVQQKSVNPILANIKFTLTESGLELVGSNETQSIKTTIPYLNAKGEGIITDYGGDESILLNGKVIVEIIKKLESDTVTFKNEEGQIIVTDNKKSHFALNYIKGEQYPDFNFERDGLIIELPIETFKDAIEKTSFSASKKEQRPILTSINFKATEEGIVLTATDSARLSKKILKENNEFEFNVNVSADICEEVCDLIEDGKIKICINEKRVLFISENFEVYARLIAGDYPNTDHIIPKKTNYSLQINSEELLKAIDKANVLADERENVVTLNASVDKIEIFSKSTQIGNGTQTIAKNKFRYEGENLTISFNSVFLTQAIESFKSEDITIKFVGTFKPFIIINEKDESVIQLLTPVRTF